ncbi:MAG: TolC family protein [Bacteroidales bacterium]|jgi:outer membrane protein TolC|nr:TolC family protein [Bacteroidales bacterium]
MQQKTVKRQARMTLLLGMILLTGSYLPAQEMLTLRDAIRIGLENNYSIIILENDAQIAENNNTAGNAGFLPTVNLSATQNNTITNTTQETFSSGVKEIEGAKNRTFNAGVQLTWTLFDGFSMFASKNMLEIMEEIGETEARTAVENTVSSIIQNYYGIIQQQKLIQVLEDAAALSLERKKIMEAKIGLGAGSELQLLQSTVDLNADSINLITETATMQKTMADLNRLLARNPEIEFILSDSISLDNKLFYDNLLAKTREQNSTLLIARNNVDLNAFALKDVQSLRYPRLNFNAAYNYNQLNSETGYLKYNQSNGPSFGLSLSYSLFDGLNINREINNARIELNTMENYLKDTDLGLHTELYKVYNDYITNLRIIGIELVNQEVARENVEVAFEKYRLGSINDIELRETQKKYIDAQYQLLLSQFQAKKAEVELLRLSGELFRVLSSEF